MQLLHDLPAENVAPASLWLRRLLIQQRYFRKFGRFVNFADPKSYREKTNYRKLYGNLPLYARLADKHRVREFVAERVGTQILTPQYGVYDQLTPEVFDTLPDQFIIKANHGCKWNQVVVDKSKLDIPATVKRFNKLMKRRYGLSKGEFHYALIEPKIVIEKLHITDGEMPVDYLFYCFNNSRGFEYGLCVEIRDTKRDFHVDENWNVLDSRATSEEIERYSRPANFDQLLSAAKSLSAGFDFVRVDLYNVAGQVYFGEMTFTPSAGLHKIINPQRDALRNHQWQLARENPLLYRQTQVA